jgi:hypothetical protein
VILARRGLVLVGVVGTIVIAVLAAAKYLRTRPR